ncbi:MAG: tRNA (5-methylaminomethyl-2-thiouridine)(34)-methyltransferase MnmD [Planctomycetota bacterium]
MADPRILTDDGSPTLWSETYQEHYHSTSGAWLEARERFVVPCRVVDRARRLGQVRILDVGFGLGWNLLWACLAVREACPGARVHAVSMERDLVPSETLRSLYSVVPDPQVAEWFAELVRTGEVDNPSVTLQLLRGAAELEIRRVSGDFDCVFLDPFSPSKNPELWEAGFLREVRERARPAAILSTYSAAVRVKIALLAAGWSIGQGPRVGAKSSGTLATNGPVDPPIQPLPARELRRLLKRTNEVAP